MAQRNWDVKKFAVSLRLRITTAMNKKLWRRARQRKKTVSELVRNAVEKDLDKEK